MLTLTRPLYFSLAWLCFLLGALGVVLPVLPTTPFMLLALWFFSKSSRRFHHWLYSHRFFGPPLRQWDRHRVIPLSAKWIASLTMLASLSYLFLYSKAPVYLHWTALIVMLYGTWFIWTKPSRAPAEAEQPEP